MSNTLKIRRHDVTDSYVKNLLRFFSPPVSVSFWLRGPAGPEGPRLGACQAAFRFSPASSLIRSLNGVMFENRFPVSQPS